MKNLLLFLVALTGGFVFGQEPVTFSPGDNLGQIHADLYGTGERGVVLAHGGRLGKESWKKQAQRLADSGFLVMAIRFRGDRSNPDGSPGSFGSTAENVADVLASVAYLRKLGVRTVYAVGASFGGDAVGEANASDPGSITRIVILASTGGDMPEKLNGHKLFIVAREDRSASGLRLPEITNYFNRAPEPKRFIVLEGSAHAQFLFDTEQEPRLTDEILQFLK